MLIKSSDVGVKGNSYCKGVLSTRLVIIISTNVELKIRIFLNNQIIVIQISPTFFYVNFFIILLEIEISQKDIHRMETY